MSIKKHYHMQFIRGYARLPTREYSSKSLLFSLRNSAASSKLSEQESSTEWAHLSH